jgi:hypothetical protein
MQEYIFHAVAIGCSLGDLSESPPPRPIEISQIETIATKRSKQDHAAGRLRAYGSFTDAGDAESEKTSKRLMICITNTGYEAIICIPTDHLWPQVCRSQFAAPLSNQPLK